MKDEEPGDTLPDNFDASTLEKDFCKVKSNLKNILFNTDICCCVCLESARKSYYMLDFTCENRDTVACTVENMMRLLFNVEDLDNLPSKVICNICQESLKQAYSFVTRVMNTSKIMTSYLDQMNEQIDTVCDQVETTGNFVNTVLVLHNYLHKPESDIFAEIYEKQDIEGMSVIEEDGDDIDNNFENSEASLEPDSSALICDVCGKSFQCRSAIIYHITNMHRDKKSSRTALIKNECSECPTRPCIHEKYLIAAFFQKKQGFNRYKCVDCDYSTTNRTNLVRHVNKQHLNFNPHLCEICGRSFPTTLAHRLHIKQHHVKRTRCEYCDRTVKNNIDQHIETCKMIIRPYKCELCPASFDDDEMLNMHSRRHEKRYTCSVCSKMFNHIASLWKHKKSDHESQIKQKARSQKIENLPVECEFCPEEFFSKVELKKHLESAHEGETYKCTICNKEFLERKKYKSHMASAPHLLRENPNKLLTFKCDKCDFSGASAWNLENHINLFHLKIKPYQCKICTKAFTTRFHLKNHLDRHAGIRNYQCTICNAMMTTLSSLKKHIFRHHESPENWPFPCDTCNKTFVVASERAFHQMQAHNEKHLPCPICKSLFHTRNAIRNHIGKVHVKGKAPEVAQFLRANMHNKELMELFRDRRKPHVDDSSNFSLTVV